MAYHPRMSRFAPLLRALLCLVLLLNGTAYAHAATRMAMNGMAEMEQTRDDTPPCHEGMDMAMQVHEEGTDPPATPAAMRACPIAASRQLRWVLYPARARARMAVVVACATVRADRSTGLPRRRPHLRASFAPPPTSHPGD